MAAETDGTLPSQATQSGEIPILALTPKAGLWIAAGIFGAFFLVAFARNVPDTLTRVALGLIFALALDPVVVRIRDRIGCTRGMAVAIVGVIALFAFALVVAFVGPEAVRQAQAFSRDLPQTVDKLTELPVVGELLAKTDIQVSVREWVQSLPTRLSDQAIVNLVESFVGGVVAGLTILIVGIAVLADGETLVKRFRTLVPGRLQQRADLIGRLFYKTVGSYFAGSLLISAIAASFVLTVGLALGVPLAPAAALWVLLTNLIPQIGGFLGGSFFTLLGFAEDPMTGILCLVLYIVYLNIENHVLQPLIIGNAVDMSPAATMLAALIGGAAGGIPGAILATPLVGTFKAIYMEIRSPGSITNQPHRKTIFTRVFDKIKQLRS